MNEQSNESPALSRNVQWAVDIAAKLVLDDDAAERQLSSTLEQRIAIALIQARAFECRDIAGKMQIQGLTQHPIAHGVWAKLIERSSQLEHLGLDLATNWPPAPKEYGETKKLVVQ